MCDLLAGTSLHGPAIASSSGPSNCLRCTQVQQWVMFDDTNITTVGQWGEVLQKCERGRIQPCLLFYERPPVARGDVGD